VTAAAVIGFVGNEAVALFQIRTGRRIGSAALVADGLHARIDGLTSLVVLAAVAGSALGFPLVDPLDRPADRRRDRLRRPRRRDAGLAPPHGRVDPALVDQIEQYAGEVPGVARVDVVRARWVGHELRAEVGVTLDDGSTDAPSVAAAVRWALVGHVPWLTLATVETRTAGDVAGAGRVVDPLAVLPPRYRDLRAAVSAAPMGAAALRYDDEGAVAWDEMWGGFCELALAGGAPHRGTLLEPVHAEAIAADPAGYERVLAELERGLHQVTGLPVRRSDVPGWIGLECADEAMALWLLRAVVVENVAVRREGVVLWFPAGPGFRLEREIKNVVTVAAKTAHYWREHVAGADAR
jgi:hypothetical protein